MDMYGCDIQIPDNLFDDCCRPGPVTVTDTIIEQNNVRELRVTKIINDYRSKTEKQIKETIQLEIDAFLTDWTTYKFVNWKIHLNKTGFVLLQLNFELK